MLKESQVDLQYIFQVKEASDLGTIQNTDSKWSKDCINKIKKIIKDITYNSEGSTF